jgi:hypothetical protein
MLGVTADRSVTVTLSNDSAEWPESTMEFSHEEAYWVDFRISTLEYLM